MKEPLVSVIVPVYNVEKYLDQCVESIVNQTYMNLEIILVDDGSPDGCPQLCDAWAAKDSRIKVIHQPNGGVSAARNAGLDIATGDYIGFVDSDDLIPEDYYEFLFNLLKKEKADIARCAHYYFDDNGFSHNCDEIIESPFVIEGSAALMEDIKNSGNKSVVIWNKLFKRSVIDNVRFDGLLSVGEDTVFLFNVYKNANSMACYDLPKYGYNIHDDRSWSRNDYNFQASRSMKRIIDDPVCPVAVYKKYFTFATMALHDIVVNGFDYSFSDLRKEILRYKKEIKKALSNDKRSRLKFLLISKLPMLYRIILRLS
ncbi:MAG: glycosyltransferase [Eubacterium sp.]|nr:glycosyltransferase [Eubacterium sp.]